MSGTGETTRARESGICFDLRDVSSRMMGHPSRRILVVDPVALTRECLIHGLQSAGEFACVAGASRVDQSMLQRPDLVIVAIRGGPVTASDLATQLAAVRRFYAEAPIVVLTSVEDPRLAAAALRSQVRGYLPTSASPEVVQAAIDLVLAGGVYIPEMLLTACQGAFECTQRSTIVADGPRLTQRETDVLVRLQEGKPNKLIAWELTISEGTVKVHVRSIMKKLNATNRTQVALRSRAA
jgi:DNA-binding NarL/FixJ family response regulator